MFVVREPDATKVISAKTHAMNIDTGIFGR
jgi:hypothetical protein